jgi:hypothetical protein
MTLDDAVGGGFEQLKGGEVDLDDGEGNRIAGCIGKRQVVIEGKAGGDRDEVFILPGDIKEEGSYPPGVPHIIPPGKRYGVDEGETGRVEEG